MKKSAFLCFMSMPLLTAEGRVTEEGQGKNEDLQSKLLSLLDEEEGGLARERNIKGRDSKK